MPFPKCKIHFNMSFGSSPREISNEDENGNVTTKIEECNKKLPNAEYFEIQNQIKAGVTLNEVNTNVINNSDGININELENAIETSVKKTKKSTKTNNEVTNEN